MRFLNIFKKRRSIVISTLVLIATIVIFSSSITFQADEHHPLTVWASVENDVEVRIAITQISSGRFRLSAIFTPTLPGFYLYSKDLPRDGLRGLGRPTLVEIIKSDTIKVTGVLEADQPEEYIYMNALGMSFPVYPAGPVTLTIPFDLIGNDFSLSITYMACSDKTCLPPVIDKHIFIQIPDKFFDE